MTPPVISDTDVFASRPVPSVELHGSLATKAWVIPQLVEQLMSFIATLRPMDGSELDIELALHESLTNAVVHGNHEEPHKRVQVVMPLQRRRRSLDHGPRPGNGIRSACRAGSHHCGEPDIPARARHLHDACIDG